MYQIAEWEKRYEVSIKGREPKDGEELRAGPLQYIRLKVYGHSQGTGFRRLQKLAGQKTMEVFGIFCKFLEISGNQQRGKRGSLLNEKDNPATIKDLAFILDVPEKQIAHALHILSNESVGWITNSTQPNTTQHNTTIPTQGYGNFPKVTETSGSKTKYLDFVLLKADEHKKLVEKLGEKQTQEKIESLNDYIGSKGTKYKSHYHTILSWAKRDVVNGKSEPKKPKCFCGKEAIISVGSKSFCSKEHRVEKIGW